MRFYLSCLLSVGGDPPSSSLCNKGSSRATARVPGARERADDAPGQAASGGAQAEKKDLTYVYE